MGEVGVCQTMGESGPRAPVGDEPAKELTPESTVGAAPLPMAAFWAVFLYFNLQLVALLGSPLIVVCFRAFDPEWKSPTIDSQDPAGMLDRLRLTLWSQILVLPLQLLILGFFGGPLLLRLGRVPAIGRFLLGFLLVSSGCYGINWIMTQVMEKGLGIPSPVHPLTRLGQGAIGPWDWTALVLSACLVAPLIEEIFFRRLLPAWFAFESGPRTLALLGIGAAIFMSRLDQPFGSTLALFTVGWAILLWLIVEWNHHWSVEDGLCFATAGLFSAIHSFAWPTPVALFFFGLWQFRLARQTQGMAAVVLFHALFNAIGVAGLWIFTA